MHARPVTIIASLLLLLSTEGLAQYSRSPQDTIRVREITSGTLVLMTPNGPANIRTEHDALIALTFGAADSARAWYEQLRIALFAPQARQEPPTAAALRRPFHLLFDARGRIRTLSTPTFPASFDGVAELAMQFDDLFLRLPATTLALGVAWEDTVVNESPGVAGSTAYRIARRIHSRVLRDTVVGGEEGWLIRAIQTHTVTSTQKLKDQPLTARTRMSGADTGIFVFSKQRGRVLGRRRSGAMTGTLTYEGGPQPVSLPVQQYYVNTVTRAP